ncbi:MAG: helix-turn-helix domain-containing protein [Actinomycetota bacterium]
MTGRNDAPPRLLTVDQVAERLNVPVAYVRRRLIFEQRITYVKIGRHVRVDESELEAFIESGRVASPPRAPHPPGADFGRPSNRARRR